MSRSSKPPPLSCSELSAFALLGAVFVVGLFVNWISLGHALAAVGFFGAIVVIAWLGKRTAEQTAPVRPSTGGERLWNAVVFIVWLGAMAAVLAWWYLEAHKPAAKSWSAPAEMREPASDELPAMNPADQGK